MLIRIVSGEGTRVMKGKGDHCFKVKTVDNFCHPWFFLGGGWGGGGEGIDYIILNIFLKTDIKKKYPVAFYLPFCI